MNLYQSFLFSFSNRNIGAARFRVVFFGAAVNFVSALVNNLSLVVNNSYLSAQWYCILIGGVTAVFTLLGLERELGEYADQKIKDIQEEEFNLIRVIPYLSGLLLALASLFMSLYPYYN